MHSTPEYCVASRGVMMDQTTEPRFPDHLVLVAIWICVLTVQVIRSSSVRSVGSGCKGRMVRLYYIIIISVFLYLLPAI
jgi:hypothetical protein